MPRESAIVLLVPEADPVVARWRARYDAAAALGVPAHVTLLYPWRTAPVTDDDLAELTAALSGARAFTLTFADFGRFPRVLYLEPDQDAPVRALILRLAAAFPEHPPYGGMPVADVVPHLTIADLPAGGELAPLAATIEPDVRPSLPIASRASVVTVLESDQAGRFTVRASMPLDE